MSTLKMPSYCATGVHIHTHYFQNFNMLQKTPLSEI